ncbi:hypothetical protein CPB86DRAFT_823846 [Serendipita vermifera]|nr:hypothetical protein CPB86DRAFT_823846 [Serendipita vermifera]
MSTQSTGSSDGQERWASKTKKFNPPLKNSSASISLKLSGNSANPHARTHLNAMRQWHLERGYEWKPSLWIEKVINDWTMEEGVYGARFKSWTVGNGLGENITWRNIHVNNMSTPIFVTQNYYDQDFGRPNNAANTSTHVNNVLFENCWGTIGPNPTDGTCISNPCWNYVPGANGTQAIIFDLYNGTAINLHAHNIQTKPFGKQYKDTTVICDPATLAPGEQDGLGFLCTNGTFKATSIKR